MKTCLSLFAVVVGVMCITPPASAQEPKKDEAPVVFPKLEHFAPLWERSIFTTKDLPSPDAPTGPNFADNLSLSGIYEIDGSVVAVLVDRTTSQVMEAKIGSENEMGIKIRSVKPGETVDKTRIQLQRATRPAGSASPTPPPHSPPRWSSVPSFPRRQIRPHRSVAPCLPLPHRSAAPCPPIPSCHRPPRPFPPLPCA
jgi:hypothetical protein